MVKRAVSAVGGAAVVTLERLGGDPDAWRDFRNLCSADSEREPQLLADGWVAIRASQPWRALVLLGQSEPGRDPLVGAEQPADDLWAVTLLAAMQQYDVIRQLARAVEESADGGKGLEVGKMAVAAGDAALQELGAGTVGLHPGVVVALQCDAVKVAKTVEEVGRDPAEVGGIADAIAGAVEHKAVRAKAIMSEVDRIACEAVDRRECGHVEGPYERHEIGGAEGEVIHLIGVTVDRDVQAAEGRSPVGRKVVSVEVGKTEGSDVGRADAGAVEALCKRARANSGI